MSPELEGVMARIPGVNVWKHPNGIYYLRYTFLGERRMESARTHDLAEAELARRRYQDMLLRGLDPRAEAERQARENCKRAATLRDLWPELELRHLRGKAANTATLYRQNFTNLGKCLVNGLSLVDFPMRELNRQIVNGFIDLRLAGGSRPATVNRDLQFLRVALNQAVAWEYLEVNPLPRLKLLPEHNRRDVGNLDPAALAPLLKALPPVLADIIAFTYYTWRRKEEVLSLAIEDIRRVDLPRPHLVARYLVKGGRRQEFPLSSMAEAIYRRNAGSRRSGPLFLNRRTGGRYKSILRVFERHVRRLDIRIAAGELLCIHDLRRLAATDAARRGFGRAEIAEGLGHVEATVTDRYAGARQVPLELFEGQTRIEGENFRQEAHCGSRSGLPSK